MLKLWDLIFTEVPAPSSQMTRDVPRRKPVNPITDSLSAAQVFVLHYRALKGKRTEWQVTDFYKKSGNAQFIARHHWFEKLALIMISVYFYVASNSKFPKKKKRFKKLNFFANFFEHLDLIFRKI